MPYWNVTLGNCKQAGQAWFWASYAVVIGCRGAVVEGVRRSYRVLKIGFGDHIGHADEVQNGAEGGAGGPRSGRGWNGRLASICRAGHRLNPNSEVGIAPGARLSSAAAGWKDERPENY